ASDREAPLVTGVNGTPMARRGCLTRIDFLLKEYPQPVLDPSTVFDDSGPLEDPLTDELLRTVEAQLGHRLPKAYVSPWRVDTMAARSPAVPTPRPAEPPGRRITLACTRSQRSVVLRHSACAASVAVHSGSRNGVTPTSVSTSSTAR